MLSANMSSKTEAFDAPDIPEEESRALVLVLSTLATRISDVEELALTVARIEALVTVWAFVADQEVNLGRAVVVVTPERSALR